MFMGEYHHNIDEKSRLVVPSNFRDLLGSSFVVTRGLEKCLYIYTLDEWNKIKEKLEALPNTKKDVRTFMRTFYSGANNAELDKSGRVVISSNLKEYANLEKECVILGVNDRIEIWDKREFDSFMDTYADKIEDIAENLFQDVI